MEKGRECRAAVIQRHKKLIHSGQDSVQLNHQRKMIRPRSGIGTPSECFHVHPPGTDTIGGAVVFRKKLLKTPSQFIRIEFIPFRFRMKSEPGIVFRELKHAARIGRLLSGNPDHSAAGLIEFQNVPRGIEQNVQSLR